VPLATVLRENRVSVMGRRRSVSVLPWRGQRFSVAFRGGLAHAVRRPPIELTGPAEEEASPTMIFPRPRPLPIERSAGVWKLLRGATPMYLPWDQRRPATRLLFRSRANAARRSSSACSTESRHLLAAACGPGERGPPARACMSGPHGAAVPGGLRRPADRACGYAATVTRDSAEQWHLPPASDSPEF